MCVCGGDAESVGTLGQSEKEAPARARSTVQRGGHTGFCWEARGAEGHRSFQWLPNWADKFWMWILLIFARSLDTFPEGGSQGWEKTGNSAASECVL